MEKYDPELLGAIARAYTHDKNAHKVLDSNLCLSIYQEVKILFIQREVKKLLEGRELQ